jgi:sulfide:quinone oxidoreductase
MELKTLAPGVAVGPQVAAGDIAALAAAGIRAILCNRPDGEAPDQPGFAEIAAAAEAAGLEARYLPVQSGMVTDENVSDFGKALETLPKPLFAYCRSGTRSATLWALLQARMAAAT